MKTSGLDIVNLSFCKVILADVFFLRQERVSHPTSFNNLSIETNLVAPLTIPSCCIFFLFICLILRIVIPHEVSIFK